MARQDYEIEQDDGDLGEDPTGDDEGLETTLPSRGEKKPQPKPAKQQSDSDLFDDLPNGIKFEPAEQTDESEDDDEDEPVRKVRKDEDEDEDEPRRGENQDKFQRRLMRERRLREEAEEDARLVQDNYTRLEKKLDDVLATVQTNNTNVELDKKIAGWTEDLKVVRAALIAATEAGDTAKAVDLQEKLTDLKSDIKSAETQKATAKATSETAAAAAKTARDAPQQNRHTVRWMRQHGKLYNSDPVFKAAAEAADRELAKNGSNPKTEQHFEELNKILAKRFPEEFPNFRGKNKQNVRRSPVSGGGEGEEPTQPRIRQRDDADIQVKGNKVRLTPRHLKVMRDFGMDPENPNDVATFVKENVARKRR